MSAGAARMDNWSAGEVGGTFAGIVALLASIGGGIRWLANWGDRRAQLRDAKLDKWEQSLTERERAYRVTMETELGELRDEMAELRGELHHTRNALFGVTLELRRVDPGNKALLSAETLLRVAFPVDFHTPGDMAEAAHRIEERDQ